MRKVTITTSIAAGLIAAAAVTTPLCAGPADEAYPRPPKPTKQYTIGVSIPQLSNPHFVGQAFGYIDEAEKLGSKVILLDAGGYQYLDRQISQVEDLIAMKVDAIILVAVNGPGTVGIVDAAVAKGIPVVNCNVMTSSTKVVSRVRSDDEIIGQMQADYMGSKLTKGGNVVMLRGAPGTSWAENRGNAFKARLIEKYPTIKVLGEQYSQSTPTDGLKLMEDFLQTFPKIDGAYNGPDTTAIGAAQAVLASGNKGKILITATDFQVDNEKFIRSGVMSATVAQHSVTIGRWGVRAMINHLEKREVPKELFTPLTLITNENINNIDMSVLRAPDGWKPPVR
jgi:ABC-type sugar transport system substrate-binding protein